MIRFLFAPIVCLIIGHKEITDPAMLDTFEELFPGLSIECGRCGKYMIF